jgi:hypothetical protein
MVGGFVLLVIPKVGADYFNAHPQYISLTRAPAQTVRPSKKN